MELLEATLEIPGWCSFRLPHGVNVHFTFPLPPITTIKGLLAAALGLPADMTGLLPRLDYAVGIVEEGEKVETLSKILKKDRGNRDTIVIKEKMLQPVFRLWLGGKADDLDRIAEALNKPFFPLYLGESDDAVQIREINRLSAKQVLTTEVDNCPVFRNDLTTVSPVELIHLPWDFVPGRRSGWRGVTYKIHWIAKKVQFTQPVEAWQAHSGVVLF